MPNSGDSPARKCCSCIRVGELRVRRIADLDAISPHRVIEHPNARSIVQHPLPSQRLGLKFLKVKLRPKILTRVFRRAGCGKSARPVRRGGQSLSVSTACVFEPEPVSCFGFIGRVIRIYPIDPRSFTQRSEESQIRAGGNCFHPPVWPNAVPAITHSRRFAKSFLPLSSIIYSQNMRSERPSLRLSGIQSNHNGDRDFRSHSTPNKPRPRREFIRQPRLSKNQLVFSRYL